MTLTDVLIDKLHGVTTFQELDTLSSKMLFLKSRLFLLTTTLENEDALSHDLLEAFKKFNQHFLLKMLEFTQQIEERTQQTFTGRESLTYMGILSSLSTVQKDLNELEFILPILEEFNEEVLRGNMSRTIALLKRCENALQQRLHVRLSQAETQKNKKPSEVSGLAVLTRSLLLQTTNPTKVSCTQKACNLFLKVVPWGYQALNLYLNNSSPLITFACAAFPYVVSKGVFRLFPTTSDLRGKTVIELRQNLTSMTSKTHTTLALMGGALLYAHRIKAF